MREISLYVHIPFCEQKCNYCAFNSFCAEESEIDFYIKNLVKEIERRKVENCVLKTIYFGGGTPSFLNENQIKKIVDAIYENFDVYEDAEFTLEANPNSITDEKLLVWKSLRVNRLSVGVQSLNDKSLKKIGRLHNKKIALEKIKLARKYFANVSTDLIIGLEKENGKDLCQYAKMLLELGVKHISCYLLEVYENTKLFQMIEEKKYNPLSDENTINAFNKLSNYLQDAGMNRYEISNFAFEGFESKHNINYWQRGEYIGFGLSAHSFIEGVRYQNANDIDGYFSGSIFVEKISLKEQIEEIIMLGLRCNLGVELNDLIKLDFDIKENPFFEDYLKQGILSEKDNKIYLNPIFYHLSNTIISNLLPD